MNKFHLQPIIKIKKYNKNRILKHLSILKILIIITIYKNKINYILNTKNQF